MTRPRKRAGMINGRKRKAKEKPSNSHERHRLYGMKLLLLHVTHGSLVPPLLFIHKSLAFHVSKKRLHSLTKRDVTSITTWMIVKRHMINTAKMSGQGVAVGADINSYTRV